jgi:tRNA A-37 threonylcarbamoyl transferase component Bud32
MALQMIDVVRKMHEVTHNVHRNIKPSNFRVKKDVLYIYDFSLATGFLYDTGHTQERFD